ncbi:hypothetical protein QJQ45_012236 [Haematococcus lacustris]|nr:hypothetical protein QJQ45_012236 [Haematococcus lacustris]
MTWPCVRVGAGIQRHAQQVLVRGFSAQAHDEASREPAAQETSTGRVRPPGSGKNASSSPAARSLLRLFGEAGAGPSPPVAQATPEAKQQPVLPLHAAQLVLQAVENVKPLVKVLQSTRGTKIMYTPTTVQEDEQCSLAVRWILAAARKRYNVRGRKGLKPGLAEELATELMLAAQQQGPARQKRDDLHRLAVDNKSNVPRGGARQ